MKIIVIDDEFAALNTFLYYVIDKYDLEIKMFMKNPLDSLDYVLKNQVNAAFLDINMPDIDGVALAKELIKINPKMLIVFISGYAFNKEKIKATIGDNLLGFCDKPYQAEVLEKYMLQIKNQDEQEQVYIQTFGSFTIFKNNHPISFKSKKSEELLALLIDRNGASISMGEVICNLWPDYNLEKSKILYRDAVWKLRKTLKENNLEKLVEFQRAMLYVNKIYPCDYWEFLGGNYKQYNGEYLTSYTWSINTQTKLSIMQEK